MGVLEWKKVNLFDLTTINSIGLQNINASITAHCCSLTKAVNGTICTTTVLCDNNGYVHVYFDNDKPKPLIFKCQFSTQPIKLCALTTNNLIAIVTQANNGKYSLCIYMYDLMKLIKKDGHPCISTTILPATSLATSIQVAEIEPDKTFALGIGFEKGEILLHFGNMNRDLSLNFRRHVIALSSINGIQFEFSNQQADLKVYHMFVTCLEGVYCFVLNDKGSVESKIVLDNKNNIHKHCCTISQPIGSESFLVVGRDDAIYCFTRDGRGPCYAFEGQKEFLSWIGHHLVVVVRNQSDFELVVLDVDIKLIVLHKRIKDLHCIISGYYINHIISRGDIYDQICTYNIYKLQEHNTTSKVQLLIANCMYDNALRILERDGNADCQNAAHVRLQYGNNLLLKGYLSRAVTEYAQTIGVIKPCDIISKLLCSRHNDDLMQYLDKLLKSKHAINEHKQLLESCFDRKNLKFKIQQMWDSRKATTHDCDFKHLSVRATNFSCLTKARHHLKLDESIISVFKNSNEQEIFNFFSEYGQELLSVYFTMVLNTVKQLIKNQQIKKILRFLIIFSENEEFCANLIADFLENSSTCDEKLYYYLLALYLGLWRNNKIPSQYILEFLKKIPLKFEKTLIICKIYLFSIGTGNMEVSQDSEQINCEDANLIKCIQFHIKKYPRLAPLLTINPRSLLMILHKLCNTPDIRILDTKSYFMKKFMDNLIDAQFELQLIGDLNDDIKINSIQLSQYIFNPIEFRSSCCDICRQSLHMPSVYFLCQHSYHKECLRYNYNSSKYGDENICVLCNNVNGCNEVPDHINIDVSSYSGDIIKGISTVFASGIVKLRVSKQLSNSDYCKAGGILNSSSLENANNPFDDNYDSNFNCY